MKRTILILALFAMALTSCRKNPFLVQWDTPYGIPPFDEISTNDYIPAIKAGIEEQNGIIDAICSNPQAPSFENTVAPLELSAPILMRVQGVLFNLSETDLTPELDAVLNEALPLLSDHESDISFNVKLYERIAAIYEGSQEGLTREQQMVLKNWYDDFTMEGIGLPEDAQKELRAINSELTTKIQKIGNNILAESNAFKEEFGISVSQYAETMAETEDRDLREKMFRAYSSRGHNGGEHDNSALVLEVERLRIRKANILGFENSASYTLSRKMAHDPQTVDNFLAGIMEAAVAKAKEEVAEMEALSGYKIEPWDWWYWSEKVRKAKYDLDEAQIKPYFRFDRVMGGAFTAAKILYGINMEEIGGVPSYNPDAVTTYKVTSDDGTLVGIYTTDPHPRSSKRGGAWMNNVREQYIDADGQEVRPIVVNVFNFQDYLSVDEVSTAFHEFGHALHSLLSRCAYPSVSGTNVTRDFVEMFSQFNENWALRREYLPKYATNDEGQPIPDELIDRICNAATFNQGFATTELAAASILDMKWHELTSIPDEAFDNPSQWINDFEKEVCAGMGLPDEIIPRYRTTYFNHIFSSGYDSGYYGYLWAEVLDKDAFSRFEQLPDGVWNRPLATQFRKTFLERGGSEEPMTLYKSFMGREPDSSPMLRARGLMK